MKLKAVADERFLRRDHPMVSINPKLKRLTIYQKTREMMIEKSGVPDFEYVILFLDEEGEFPHSFWMKPANEGELNARKLNVTSDSTRTLAISMLLNKMEWGGKKTERFPVIWDKRNKCARVDLPVPDSTSQNAPS
ncbi:MAG: hypothetical protein ACLP5H_23525 [Desulfomonilaceae bacterium]